jgi:hypothetical protein
MDFTLDREMMTALLSILAGILILISPRLLNYIVAIYLIVVGALMLMARL